MIRDIILILLLLGILLFLLFLFVREYMNSIVCQRISCPYGFKIYNMSGCYCCHLFSNQTIVCEEV